MEERKEKGGLGGKVPVSEEEMKAPLRMLGTQLIGWHTSVCSISRNFELHVDTMFFFLSLFATEQPNMSHNSYSERFS